ncbi:HAD-IA family hydrolase [Halodurantibacterium flavum]|uniref:HAD-IA family hydrolase n=1 Tax=Halodurantibacterium flavum TaxID=1382802 RepID=A0ABW4S2P4_9RHOB
MDLRLIVFDVDGTLVDSQDEIVAAMGAAFEGASETPPPRAAILSIVGLSLPVAVRTLAPHLSDAGVEAVVAGYKHHFMTARVGGALPALYPGALDALRHLHGQDGNLLGIATGKSRRGLSGLLSAHALDGYFVTRQVADDHPSKPHPSMLQSCLRETGVAADRGIMIGDTTYDMQMGRAAGLRTIGVTWGYHNEDLLKDAGADLLLRDYAELADAIDDMLRGAA